MGFLESELGQERAGKLKQLISWWLRRFAETPPRRAGGGAGGGGGGGGVGVGGIKDSDSVCQTSAMFPVILKHKRWYLLETGTDQVPRVVRSNRCSVRRPLC